jgi:hypothetical protein
MAPKHWRLSSTGWFFSLSLLLRSCFVNDALAEDSNSFSGRESGRLGVSYHGDAEWGKPIGGAEGGKLKGTFRLLDATWEIWVASGSGFQNADQGAIDASHGSRICWRLLLSRAESRQRTIAGFPSA